jgi:hypothetical protein
MPGCPRKDVVDPDSVGVYHVWGRCVRRAWLCGDDPLTGTDHSERREWIRKLQEQLAQLFAIEVEFHAEMSNHLHLLVRTRPDIVATWPDDEVVRRMLTVHKIIHSLDGQVEPPSEAEVHIESGDPERVAELRRRLQDLSWFMKALRETIARRANHCDGIAGAFWDGRYRCRRLIDETAILICGIYIDLNQIRAGEATTPEESRHTSVFDRIVGRHMRKQMGEIAVDPAGDCPQLAMQAPDGWLGELTLQDGPGSMESEWTVRSRTGRRASDKGLLPLTLEKYLELLDWTGRELRDGKCGAIPASLAPILERLRIRAERWCELIDHYDRWFRNFVGHMDARRAAAVRLGKRCVRGIRQCSAAFL